MQEYTIEQIQEKYEQLPREIQEAISSDEVLGKIRAIGQKHGLMIDEIGDLIDQVALIMLGLAKASEFVSDISRRIAIDQEGARAIASEINTAVFDALKTKMMEVSQNADKTTPHERAVLSIEKAGNFTIEKEVKIQPSSHMLTMVTKKPQNLLAKTEESHYEPLVEQLMRGSTAIPEEKVVKTETLPPMSVTPPPIPAPIPTPEPISTPPTPEVTPPHAVAEPPVNLPTSDPYREMPK